MCGIIGYIGKQEALPILLDGLRKLEYRGYDSAGIAIINGSLDVFKKKGKVSVLEEFVSFKNLMGNIGIGHTRWATHGEPNDINAHPQQSQSGCFSVVHNGIIENYSSLKADLIQYGFTFQSDTDTEVLANLIEFFYNKSDEITAGDAVRLALLKVTGAYGIAVLCNDEKDKIIAARKGSPLVIGLGDDGYWISSDASPVAGSVSRVVYINDNDLVIIRHNGFTLQNILDNPVSLNVSNVNLKLGELTKGIYEHYMLKEIFEQPNVIEDTFRGRLIKESSEIVLGGLHYKLPTIVKASRIIIVGCGTSWHAALIGEYLLETYARVPVEVEYASEFRYRNPVINNDDVVIFISQSGETADTLAALRMIKERGVTTIGVCNVVGSSLSRETDAGVFTRAGIEVGVASTKAFIAQVAVLTLFAVKLAHLKGHLSDELYSQLINELALVPEKEQFVLQANDSIRKIAKKYMNAVNALYLGRGIHFPVALEAALKLKEISYVHAEGYAAGEMKHGPIALIDDQLPVVVIALRDSCYEKITGNIQEVKARKGSVIALVTQGDSIVRNLADDVIEIPVSHPAVSPLLAVVPLQLLAYHLAVFRNCNVDQPRNLAKSVTVE